MKERHGHDASRRLLRSVVRRTGVAMADASGSYAVQHLPEWMAKSSFDFAAWLADALRCHCLKEVAAAGD